MSKRWLVLGFVATLAACGGDDVDPEAACNELVEVTCAKVYECLSSAELQTAGYPPGEPACVSQFKVQLGCAEATVDNACDGNETYHPEEVDDCVDQNAGLSCQQVRDGTGETPACDRICTVE